MKKWIKSILCGVFAVSMLASTACLDFSKPSSSSSSSASSSEADPTKYNGKTAAQTYTAIQTKVEEANSGTIETKMTIGAKTEGMTMEMTMNMISKSNGTNTYTEVSTKATGQNVSSKEWYVDGVLYSNANGYKIKQNMTLEEYQEYTGASDDDGSALFKVKNLAGVEFVEEEGGVYFIAPLASSELGELAGSISGSTTGVVISDVEYIVHIDEDSELRYLEVNFKMVQSVQGMTLNYTVDCTMYIKNLNKTIISAPSDAGDYVDATSIG